MVYMALFILLWLVLVVSYITIKAYQSNKDRLTRPQLILVSSCSLLIVLVACGKPLTKKATIENKMYARDCIHFMKNEERKIIMLEELDTLNKERDVYNLANKCFEEKYGHKKTKVML